MARIRTVKPEHWSDKKLPKISRAAHLTWIGIWNFSDDRGVIEADPLLIKANVYPRRTDVSVKDIEKEIAELIEQKYLVEFTYQDDLYYITRTFGTHQKIDKPRPSRIPAEIISRVIAEPSANDREKDALYSKGEEGKGTVLESKSSKELSAAGAASSAPSGLLAEYKKNPG